MAHKMISNKVNAKLCEQIINEFHAAHVYLAMSCTLVDMGLTILAKWFLHHADEERSHGMRLLNYIHEAGGKVQLDAIPKPDGGYKTVEQIVQKALDHELLVTGQINDLVALAESEKDYATRSILQWFVDEQVEEVSVVSGLLQLVQLAGEKHMLQVEARVAKMMEDGS